MVRDDVWALWDVLPTVAELAGVEAPPETDGISMGSVLLGGDAPCEHDYLYWEFYEHGSSQAVRKAGWKAVRKPMLTGTVELYDLARDVGETIDLAQEHPTVVEEMIRLMEEVHTPSPVWSAPNR